MIMQIGVFATINRILSMSSVTISTGISLSNSIAFPVGFETGGYNIIFDQNSTSTISHIINVDDYPFVVEAFGLVTGENVEVWQVGGPGPGTWFSPLVINNKPVVLTTNDNKLSLDVSGRYQFRLSSDSHDVDIVVGSVYVVGHEANVASQLVGLGKYVI